mmetsp:Transcript_15057/g.19775  ORF Transcript_15057/g.19775 Transcript_15057/m.19775 type:complete len:360 (-) Transcript_15057:1330-2409(-)
MAPPGRPRRGSLIRHNQNSNKIGTKNQASTNKGDDQHQKQLINKVLDGKSSKVKPGPPVQNKAKTNTVRTATKYSGKRFGHDRKEPEPEYTDNSEDSLSSDFSSDYDSDLSSSYYSSDGDYGRRNIFGSCCSSIFSFGKTIGEKFIRNWVIAYNYSLRFMEFMRSEKVTNFLAKVVKVLWVILLFLASVWKDTKKVLSSTIKVVLREGFAITKVVGKHTWHNGKYVAKEALSFTGLAIVLACEKAIELSIYLKRGIYMTVMFPYWLGKAIVNLPWLLYDVFFENTEKLAPVIYGLLGWGIVFFVYIPILASILHALDVLTMDDLDSLGLKNICLYLGLVREERGFWIVMKKLGGAIFQT